MITAGAVCARAVSDPQYKTAHPLSPMQAAQIDKAIAQEKLMMDAIRRSAPLVETYIQNTRPDEKLNTVPVSDEYMLSRVDFAKTFIDKRFADRSSKTKSENRFFKGSADACRGILRQSAGP